MKKLLCLLLVIVCGLMLWSCQGSDQTPICYAHTDADSNLRCDDCGEKIECIKHIDTNENLACDNCGKTIKCTHKDENNDGVCDVKGCKYQLCEHEYEDVYSKDENYHWFANSCSCLIEPKDKAAHIDNNNDGLCDVCEWNYDHLHIYEENWSHSETQHWYSVTCGHNVPAKSLGDHVDENNDRACDVCAWDYGHTHTYEDAWSHDAKEHWKTVTCGHSIAEGNVGLHEDADNDSVCDVCAWDFDHTHEYDDGDDWTFDETGHWHAATCGHDVAGIDFAEHKESDGICEICEYVMCDNHRFIVSENPKWTYNETTHWIASECGHASASMEPAGHSYNTTVDGWSICKCGYCPHYTTDYSYDETDTNTSKEHWFKKMCDCEGVDDKYAIEEHTDANKDGICDECLYQFCKHYWGEWEQSGDGLTHWQNKQCSHNAPAASEPVLHTEADANNDGICDACTAQYCTHQYHPTYSYDENNHWYASACGHSVVKDKAAHDDADNNGQCDTCKYQFCEHTYNPDNWGRDTEWHWNVPDCSHNIAPINKAKHIDADNNGVCDVCIYKICTHEAREWAHDDINHWRQPLCGHIGLENTDLAAHADEIGGINGGKDGKCDTCEYVMCTHTYADTYSQFDADGTPNNAQFAPDGTFNIGGTHHGRVATCGCDIAPTDFMLHRDSEEAGKSDGLCDYCYELGENSVKVYFVYCTHPNSTGDWQQNETHHWYQIECCDIGILIPHVDENNDGICEECTDSQGNPYQFCYHWNTTEWAYDTKEHWHARTCTHSVAEKIDAAAHVDANFDEICDICKHYCDIDDDSFGDNGSAGTGDNDNLSTPVSVREED